MVAGGCLLNVIPLILVGLLLVVIQPRVSAGDARTRALAKFGPWWVWPAVFGTVYGGYFGMA